jgi:hypothetical protein
VAMSAAGSGSPLTAECASDRAESRTLSRRPTWGVAYDFNVLVVLIQGYSRLLLQRLAPDDPLCGVLRDIERSSDRAAAVLRGEHGDATGRGVPNVGSPWADRGNGTFAGAQ